MVYGTAGMALAMLAFGITLISSRNPHEPVWAKEFLVANIYVPFIVVLGVLGVGCLIKFIISIGSQTVGVKEIGMAVANAAACIWLLKRLRIKQHLSAFESMEKSAEIIKPAVFFKKEVEVNKPEPPAKPTSTGKAA